MPDIAFDAFRRLLGETFRMQTPDGRSLPIVLTACDGTADTFSLTFRAGPDAPDAQATYLLGALGRDPEPVFLVPARRHADAELPLEYTAVFNLVPAERLDGGARWQPPT